MAVGDSGLREAVERSMEWIYLTCVIGPGISDEEWERPLFTYLLTKKQYNALKAICSREGWPPPVSRGITFYPHHISHILTARQDKNRLTWQDSADVLNASLSPRSILAPHHVHDQQVFVLNSLEVLKVGPTGEKYRGILIVETTINDLTPVTAYNATEAKSRAILRNNGL
jgi:hypothetical protein